MTGIARRRAGSHGATLRRVVRSVGVVLALLCVLVGTSGGFGRAIAAERADVSVEDAGTHGRVVVDFPALNLLPKHTVRSTNGVLVLEFDVAVEMDVNRIPIVLGRYVTIARNDPDGRGARLALNRLVRVNTMEAGGKLFIDFLPTSWTGPPPRLPEEVVAELARKADEAAKLAREAEILRQAGTTKPELDLRVGRNPTFTRLSFGWNLPFQADFKRGDTSVVLTFDRKAAVDLAPIKADMPPFLEDISVSSEPDGGLVFRLVVQPVADVRAFREDKAYVVDIQGPLDPATLDPTNEAIQAVLGGDGGGSARVVSLGTAPEHAEGTDHAPAHDGAGHAAAPAPEPVTDPTDQAIDESRQVRPKLPLVVTRAAEPTEEHTAPPAAQPAPAQPEEDDLVEGGTRRLVDDAVRVEAKRIGRATRVVFPYKTSVGSALFTRGPALWFVVDSLAPLDLDPLREALAGLATSIEPLTIGEARALRIVLAEPLLATLNADGTYWVVTIGDIVMEPTRPLPIKRSIREDGTTALDIPFGRMTGLHDFTDPAIGDRLVVVTGLGPARGLIKPQSFVEVQALSSAHGLAFVPLTDDVEIRAENTEVSIDRPDGLSVSTAVPAQRATLIDMPRAMGAATDDRPGYVDFGDLEAETPPDFWRGRHELTTSLAQAKTREERVSRWYRMAEFLLANGMAFEAIGSLNLIASFATEEATSQRMAMLRAAASVLANRPKDALDLLDRPEFETSPDAAVWKTIALEEIGDHPGARKTYPRGDAVVGSYPKSIQTRFLLAGIESAVELNDFGRARSLLAQLDPRFLTPNDLASIDLLNARAADATGHITDAIDLLSKAVQSSTGPVEAEATYRLVNLQRREGLITLDQAADRLEQLAVSWRGDEIELKTLRTLAQISVERDDYRRGFELMRIANEVGPGSDTTRLMQEEMQSAFSELFLDGKAKDMPPVEALALYYDFRELTPNGRRGDEMVRKLADRLVEVDLLPQAAELLSYQVDNRLRGAAKAKVAADLALIYLLDDRPDLALLTLSRSRQADLPIAIERQRRLVEAKALADTGKPDLGLELLKPLSGGEIQRLRAEILWTSGRYQDAGETFERLVGARWSEATPLGAREQLDVMRAGISYALAEDRLGVDRLRSKFAAKMAETPNGGAFQVVTSPVEGSGTAFNDIVMRIAKSDAVEGFLEDYRTRYINSAGDDRPEIIEQPVPGAEPVDVPPPSAENRVAPPVNAG
ncbi:hypothetical protein [Chthonobacter rhizosphaerae]|uniref:hypothetical protein n=1 Tax=Chthonobacter rhizosphaerae TaxID=2735553 RepID=UPI0015EF0572|nr:hypothetical protein [Chthonobacter rhizosphaerae]